MDRFSEFVGLLRDLLTSRAVDFEGRYWSAHGARSHPGCIQQPRVPFAIAATGPKAMRIAAQDASAWVTNGDRSHKGPPLRADDGAAVVARQRRLLEEVCEEVDRVPATIDTLVLTGPRLDLGLESTETFRATRDAYAAVTDLVVHWPRPEPPYLGDDAILAEIRTPENRGQPPRTDRRIWVEVRWVRDRRLLTLRGESGARSSHHPGPDEAVIPGAPGFVLDRQPVGGLVR